MIDGIDGEPTRARVRHSMARVGAGFDAIARAVRDLTAATAATTYRFRSLRAELRAARKAERGARYNARMSRRAREGR